MVVLRKLTGFPKTRPNWWLHRQGQELMGQMNRDPELTNAILSGKWSINYFRVVLTINSSE